MLDILAEVLGLMDEPRHAQRVLAELAARDVVEEHRALVEAATCGPVAGEGPGARASTTICAIDTPCGAQVRAAVFFEPITGAVTDATDLAGLVHAACPEMLADGAARRVAARSLGEDVP